MISNLISKLGADQIYNLSIHLDLYNEVDNISRQL